MSQALICDGEILITSSGSPNCSSGWHAVSSVNVEAFDYSQLVATDLVAAYSLGFFLSLPVIAAAYGVRVLTKMISNL